MLLVGADIWFSFLPCIVLWGEGWKDLVCSVSLLLSFVFELKQSLLLLRHLFEHEGGDRIPFRAVWADCHSGVGVSWCVEVGALRRVTGWWACLKPSVPFEPSISPLDRSPIVAHGQWGLSIGSCPQTWGPALTFQPFAWKLWATRLQFLSGQSQNWAYKRCFLG